MKLGRNLHRYEVLEWAPFYIDYQTLKKLYKVAKSQDADQEHDAKLTEFQASLQQNLSKARSFYKAKYENFGRRLNSLYGDFGIESITDLDSAGELEAADLEAAFIELRVFLKRLLWYWVVNFDKILGALVKFQADLAVSTADIDLRTASVANLSHINDWLDKKKLRNRSHNAATTHMALLRRKYMDEKLFQMPLMNAFAMIERDDTLGMDKQLKQCQSSSVRNENGWTLYLFETLHFSVLKGSQSCTASLLSYIGSLKDFGDHIHQLIKKIGRRQILGGGYRQVGKSKTTLPICTPTKAADQLVDVITNLGPRIRRALQTKDSFGKIPLHYAVQYDLLKVCEEILACMGGIESTHSAESATPALTPDEDGLTPLDQAVLTSNAAVVNLLLEDHRRQMESTRSQVLQFAQDFVLSGHYLNNALRLESIAVVRLLSRASIDIMYADDHGNTPLHNAVRSRKLEYVVEILEAKAGITLNAREAIYGWTPLILASAIGDLPIVEYLLQAGANPMTQDDLGWYAKDHAAFRGWLPTAKKLQNFTEEHLNQGHLTDFPPELPLAKYGLTANLHEYHVPETSPNQSQIFVNLGALDTYKPVTGVDMTSNVWPDAYDPQCEADYQVRIRAVNGDRTSHVTQLPILEDMANKPYRFVTDDAKNFKLAFDIYHSKTSGHTGDSFIGSAVALLDSLKQGLGSTRESLIRNFTIPILHKETLEFIGTVTFYLLIMTPFPHPDPKRVIQQKQSFPSPDGPPIIGHRGESESHLRSFLSAKKLGATYIEASDIPVICMLIVTDVQLTKDDIPIIYHDFLMSETGIDAPLHGLNLEQFMYISNAQSTEDDIVSSAEGTNLARVEHKRRSYSVNICEQPKAKSLIDRMKHTFEFKLKESRGFDSYKGNIRTKHIQSAFATLEDLLTQLPESVSFDIEIKYPMLFEAHDWGMETSAVEANHLVDSVLDCVYRLAKNRIIFFSSFSPEVCILLSKKQHIYPVFFLSESGHIPSSDLRADSLQEAIWFAKSWRLAGVISRSEPLVISPHLIEYVKNAGLLCISWGGLNDIAEHAKTQADAGLDAIITNSVKLISKTLHGA
ncbi:hypothetical protein G7Y79_00029g063070 [Physcia stellaris]|nr:hypothetical protein G7Y79_00029g063070 [Physcia stellaris]